MGANGRSGVRRVSELRMLPYFLNGLTEYCIGKTALLVVKYRLI